VKYTCNILVILPMQYAETSTEFAAVCTSRHYKYHYTAIHREFMSAVVVVLWTDLVPGPTVTHNGLSVLYVYHGGDFDGLLWTPPSVGEARLYSESERNKAYRVEQIVERHQDRLFQTHSNLVAIRALHTDDTGKVCINFVVPCKGYIPINDRELLPREVDGIPTKVSAG
jgi:hypothetical protein